MHIPPNFPCNIDQQNKRVCREGYTQRQGHFHAIGEHEQRAEGHKPKTVIFHLQNSFLCVILYLEPAREGLSPRPSGVCLPPSECCYQSGDCGDRFDYQLGNFNCGRLFLLPFHFLTSFLYIVYHTFTSMSSLFSNFCQKKFARGDRRTAPGVVFFICPLLRRPRQNRRRFSRPTV